MASNKPDVTLTSGLFVQNGRQWLVVIWLHIRLATTRIMVTAISMFCRFCSTNILLVTNKVGYDAQQTCLKFSLGCIKTDKFHFRTLSFFLEKHIFCLFPSSLATDKLPSTMQNLVRAFNSRSGCMCAVPLCRSEAKRPSLMLKTESKTLGLSPVGYCNSRVERTFV